MSHLSRVPRVHSVLGVTVIVTLLHNISRNLLVEGADLNDEKFEIYEPVGSASDIDEDVRVSRIQLNVVRCRHATFKDEDWHKSNVFYTYVVREGKSYKL